MSNVSLTDEQILEALQQGEKAVIRRAGKHRLRRLIEARLQEMTTAQRRRYQRYQDRRAVRRRRFGAPYTKEKHASAE